MNQDCNPFVRDGMIMHVGHVSVASVVGILGIPQLQAHYTLRIKP